MYQNFSKTTLVVSLSLLMSGMLCATTPSQLGKDFARHTMEGLVDLIKADDSSMVYSKNRIKSCIEEASDYRYSERVDFLEAGMNSLISMDLGRETACLDEKERARAYLLKEFAITYLSKSLEYVYQGGRPFCFTSLKGKRTLFSWAPMFSREEILDAFVHAANANLKDWGLGSQVSRENMWSAINNKRTFWGARAKELIDGCLGDVVNQFLLESHIYSVGNEECCDCDCTCPDYDDEQTCTSMCSRS